VAVAAAALMLLRLRPTRPWLAGGLVALVAALDLLLWANAFQPMGPTSVTIPPRTPAVAYLQRHVNDGRVAGLNNALVTDWSTIYGLRDVRGYDAPQPSRRFFHLWQVLHPEQEAWRPFDIAGLSPESLGVLGLLGARYIITEPNAKMPPEREFRALSIAYRGDDATVVENALASPRALVAERVHVAASEDEEIATVARTGFDPRREAVVRSDEVGNVALQSYARPGSVRVIDDENARVALQARLTHPGLVVLDDAWAPGWSVSVDGEPAPALQADMVMRGVIVPAGEHEVVWSYRVPGLRLGALLSGLGLIALLAWAGVLVVQSRRAPR
jgi:hypothetical protein